MQKKTIITFAVIAVVLTAVIVGAVFLYDYLREDVPGDMQLRPPIGGQPDGTVTSPTEETGGTESPPQTGQTGGTESPSPTGQTGGEESSQPTGQTGGTESPTSTGQTGGEESTTTDGNSEEQDLVAAPDFTVVDISGNEVRLSDLKGQPVVLNFWASWCPPCKEEMPHFNTVFEELGSEVHFMMVCLADGARETTETGAAYVSEMGFSFPVYFDVTGEASIAYGLQSIPATYFIDSKGYLATMAAGSIPESTLRMGVSYIMD